MRPTLQIAIQRQPIAFAGVALSVLAVAGLSIMGGMADRQTGPPPSATVVAAAFPVFPVPPLPPPWPLVLAETAYRTVEGEFTAGDTFAGVLMEAGVDADLVNEIAAAARPRFNLRKIRAGRPYRVYFDRDDALLMFRYQPDKQTAVLVAHGREGWGVREVVVPYEIRPRYIRAEVRGSLEGAIADTWVSRRDAIDVSHKLAAIFAWDIDFAADLRLRDTIDLVIEQRFLEDELSGFGDILAAELRVDGRLHKAVRYARNRGVTSYYKPSGESLQRAFLRSPVRFTRISSGFTYRRLHPILNVVRPHLGVDYVAPAGTPVHATAAGTVRYIGRNAQAGNHVKIRHGGSYTSWYLHLSGAASGLRVGQPVEQGQVIGYVGKTGLATAAHLDYRLERNGEFLDPLQIDFPAAASLAEAHRDEFEVQRDRWLSLLRQGQRAYTAILLGSSE
jgi:murein DD-endopeptidase MepM/ murein hydrolase activator NlpD